MHTTTFANTSISIDWQRGHGNASLSTIGRLGSLKSYGIRVIFIPHYLGGRGSVWPHQLHREKDGPPSLCRERTSLARRAWARQRAPLGHRTRLASALDPEGAVPSS